MNALVQAMATRSDTLVTELEAIYKDFHQHPELSMQEFRTAKVAGDYIQALGYEVTREVGVTGLVGVLRNGEGPTVMLRADMDALPMAENTGLSYASTVKARDEDGVEVDVAHSCGHDMHVTWLMGVARVLAEHRDAWKGTVMLVFQPGEEVGRGASSMVNAWHAERFPKPDIILGQHVMVGPSGTVSYRPGVILSAGDSLKIRLFGRGSHGSQPQTSIDPVIMAASTTLRLQTIVSREISPMDNAVLTIGSLQAGTKENIIPDEATIKLNMRTFDEDVREYMLASIRRICCAECDASNAERPPEFTTLSTYPLTENDIAATSQVADVFKAQFGDKACEARPASASEDFSVFGRAWNVPYVFWFIGGTDPEVYAQAKAAKQLNRIPSNHSPKFAPVIHPTLQTGLQAMLTAASAWLCQAPESRDGT
ncbi:MULTISPECIES: M20 family metallopeptidase [Cupriavidus]|uniref:Peptidase M20D, amidohydrolase n=1 Tax=Cupriavidus pinatubonensis (strain JMP 134 / LMG 1197) TaxID=264198 RepID=Q46QM1_CUPPJ|nr:MULTISPECIES: M20 family metallopeptidase [Cupriavidus]QYY27802.1 amidohydrolase [Cupriavidus pinatubonensis]TPQ40200.1 amidohydrolase [Cupriavidus pinatubonensis]